jgi:hypothetical protein
LEKLENEEINDIDFLELRACYQSCAGGILCAGNKFLVTERAKKRVLKASTDVGTGIEFEQYQDFVHNNYRLHGKIHPRSIVKLDDNMAEAMRKMQRINKIKEMLPNVDCGICGAPSCQAFAEDIVQKEADIRNCVFVQKILQQNNQMDWQQSIELMKKTWGECKLNKDSIKELDNEY